MPMELIRRLGYKKIASTAPLLIGVILITFAGYGWYWNTLAGKFLDAIEDLTETGLVEGYKLISGPVEVGGFPFWLHLSIADPILSISKEKQSWNWRGPTIKFSTRPWQMKRIKVRAPGRHLATFTTQHGTRNLDIKAGGLNVFLNWSILSTLPITAQGELKKISYRFAPVLGLGRETKIISFQAELTGAPPSSINSTDVAHWRNQGGTLEVRNLTIHHGPLEIRGEGTIAMSEDLQPLAAFSLKVHGYMETLDSLQSSKLIKPNEAKFMKAVLSMLVSEKQDGEKDNGGNWIDVPLSIQDGYFYIGPLAVGRVPILQWSALN